MRVDRKKPSSERLSQPSIQRRDSVTISHEGHEYLAGLPVDPSLELGARTAIESCLALRHDESVLVVCEIGQDRIAAAIVQAADATGAGVSAFVVGEDHARNDGFNARLSARLDEVDASVLVATVGGLPAEFRRRLLQTGPRRRHAHMVGITDAMMQQSMRADYDEVHAIGERLRARFTPECSLKVETTAGTNLVVRTHPQHKWHNASGLLRGPGWANLPGGEVFTTPLTVDGLLVPDGGAFLPGGEDLSRGGRLRLRFARGILIQVEGPGADAFEDALRDTTNAMRVGQVGFGTNTSLLTSVGSLLQDLKMPGLHLSLGYTCGELTGATWTSAMEIPLLMRRPDVVLDETPLMVRGRYARGIGPD